MRYVTVCPRAVNSLVFYYPTEHHIDPFNKPYTQEALVRSMAYKRVEVTLNKIQWTIIVVQFLGSEESGLS